MMVVGLGLLSLLIAFLVHLIGPWSWTLRFGIRFDSSKASIQTIWNFLTLAFDLVAAVLWVRWEMGASWRALAAAWLIPWLGWGAALALAIGITMFVH